MRHKARAGYEGREKRGRATIAKRQRLSKNKTHLKKRNSPELVGKKRNKNVRYDACPQKEEQEFYL